MSFDQGTAYAESDADDEYERGSLANSSPVTGHDSEASPIDSELTSSNEHTPTTYGHRSSADRLPETIISEWTADECADFISTIGLQQYSDRFIGGFFHLLLATDAVGRRDRQLTLGLDVQRMKLLARRWWRCSTMTSSPWALLVSATV